MTYKARGAASKHAAGNLRARDFNVASSPANAARHALNSMCMP